MADQAAPQILTFLSSISMPFYLLHQQVHNLNSYMANYRHRAKINNCAFTTFPNRNGHVPIMVFCNEINDDHHLNHNIAQQVLVGILAATLWVPYLGSSSLLFNIFHTFILQTFVKSGVHLNALPAQPLMFSPTQSMFRVFPCRPVVDHPDNTPAFIPCHPAS